MRKLLFVAAAAAASAMFAAAPAMAAGSPVLTLGSVGGTGVASGASLSAGIASGTKVSVVTTSGGSTGITCTAANLAATAGANPDGNGNADETATLTTTTCTSNITGVTKVNSVTLNNQPYNATVTPGGVVSVTGTITSTVSLQTVLGAISCTYTATNNASVSGATSSLSAVAHNTGNTIAISNNQFNLTTGSGLCPKNGFLTATVGPVTSGGQKVFVTPGQS